jgi:hypothetical protein
MWDTAQLRATEEAASLVSAAALVHCLVVSVTQEAAYVVHTVYIHFVNGCMDSISRFCCKLDALFFT